MRFRLIRHASLLLDVAGKKILVDPMLSKKGAMDPVKNAADSTRIPMVELPFDDRELRQLLKETDLVLVTHVHRDHWDIAAQQLIEKDKTVFCQPADEMIISDQGFTNVQVIEKNIEWHGIKLYRTNGQHGSGETGKAMGTVSGFVVEYGAQRLYITGDTIWCRDVEEALDQYMPGHIIANGGGARFLEGGPITMTTHDITRLSGFSKAIITVIHLDTINHCIERRYDFKKMAEESSLSKRILIPEDGDWITV